MKKKMKAKLSKALSLLLVVNMVLSLVIATDVFYNKDNKAFAAISSEMGTGSYNTGISGGATLTEGKTYTFGGKSWIAAEVGTEYAVLQSTGLTGGAWPGYAMSGTLTNAAGSTITLTGKNTYYTGNIDGYDISNYNSDTQSLYSSIKAAEYTAATYGKGLYLVSNSKAGTTSSGSQGSGYYWSALKSAATSYSSFGAGNGCAWLGTVNGSYGAWCVNQNRNVYYGNSQGVSYVVAPAFNLDLSKVRLSSGTTLEIATFQDSTGIEATQSITSVEEGSTTDLASIITAVKYVGGDNAGKSASYKISTSDGNINGTKWTAPTGINTNKSVELTITEQTSGKKFYTKKTVTVTPKAAKSITVEQKQSFPDSMKSGESVDLASNIIVTGYDQNSESDGVLGAYTLSSDDGTFDGTVFTAGKVTTTKDVVINVTGNGALGSVSYVGKTATFKIKVKPDTTGWTDRDEDVDAKGFHTYVDDSTEITWKYKYDDNGNINYLYTESNVAQIISDGNVLLIPSTISGVPVVGIGGGDKDGDTIPFIPTSGENKNNTWTSIYFPASVKTINDGAFLLNDASANIVIPGTIKKIGVCAFKGSGINSVIFNDAESLTISSEAFADIPTLEEAVFRGSGVTICERAFSNATGLTSLTIPNGTKFKGETDQNNSFAFQGTTGLEIIKIDTDQVYSNTFSANKNLKKVIFGENVTKVKYDWSGTAASNSETCAATVARTTYSLNAETVFEMDKTSGGSPFGYANALTVIGKNKNINGDSYAYNNHTDPVTAKIAYLATYYQTNNEAERYAKGTGTSVTITAEEEPADNSGVTSTETPDQTGIEAYYNGIIFTGKQLEKSKMTVYKMFGNKQNGKYEVADFYVLRTTDADTLLNKQTTDYQAGGVFVADQYSDNKNIVESFEEKDSITINSEDLEAGTVDVKIIVLLKDNDGHVLVNDEVRKVIAYSYTVAIPVKEYTEEEDFFENYGSYSSVISTVNALKKENTKLSSDIADLDAQISEKNAKISELDEKIATAEGNITSLESEKAALEQEKNNLASQKTTLQAELNQALLDYNNLVEKFAALVGSTEIGENDFTYTDKNTGDDYVYINGKDLPYEKSTGTEKTLSSGEKVIVYKGTGDVTGSGNASDTFYFYVKEDGVHYVTLDPSGNIMSDEVYTTTIDMMQKQAMAEINGLKKELSDINTALDNLYAALDEAMGDLGISDAITMDGENAQSAADKINSITSMVNTLSAAYNKTNDSMRLTIAKIDIALGYGEEVRYDGKLVMVASNTSYTSNRLPATIYYTITGSGDSTVITYLTKSDETFSAIGDQSAYETAFNEMLKANASSVVNYIKITDPVNGFKTDSADPYSDYQKAIKAFLAAFDKYANNTDTLIETVNNICGTNIEIPGSGATTEEINTAIAGCLTAVNTQLNTMNSQNSGYANQYAVAANALSEFLNEFNGGQNIATITIEGDVVTITQVSDNDTVKALGITLGSAAAPVKENDKIVGITIDGKNFYLKNNGDGTYTAMLIASEDAAEISSAAKACVAELSVARGKLDAVDTALEDLYDALDSAFKQMGLSGLFEEGTTDESAADKINSISGMISIITNSYNALQAQYGELSDDYQAILNYVYGDYEKTADDVTADDVIAQLEKNKKDEIDQKVAEALENAGAISDDSVKLQQDIAEAIEAAAAGEAYDTTGMSQEMIAALATISTMKGQLEGLKEQVEALQNGNEAITSMLETLSTALGFDSVQDQATIIAAIQSLRDQVATLTDANNQLASDKALLVAANEQLTAENTALKASGSTTDNNTSYQSGYNAGYTAGFTAGSKNTSSSGSSDYQTGYNAGYNAAAVTLSGSNNEKVSNLTTQVSNLTQENTTLTSTVQAYENGIDDLYEEVLTNSDGATATLSLYGVGSNSANYTTKLSKIKSYYSTLSSNYKTANSQVTTLSKENKTLKSQNKKLEEKNESLKQSNTTLKGKVTSLQSSNNSLQTQLSNARKTNSVSVQSQPVQTQQTQPAQPAQTQSSQVEQAKPSITVTASDKKEDETTEEPETEEPVTEEPVEEEEIDTVTLDGADNALDFNATAEDPAESESDVINGGENADANATDQASSGSMLPLILFIVLFVTVIGAIVFFFAIKPRMATSVEDDDDDDEETV